MAYNNYDDTAPNFHPMTGTDFCDAVRNNQNAIMDMVSSGLAPIGWQLRLNTSGGSEEYPTAIVYDHFYTGGFERVIIIITWGTVGAEENNPTSIDFKYSPHTNVVSELIGTLTLNWSATSNNCTSMTWV